MKFPRVVFQDKTPETSDVCLCKYCGEILYAPEEDIFWEDTENHKCVEGVETVLTTALAKAEADVKRLIVAADNPSGMKCDACRRTGMFHCSDPVNCGSMIPITVDEAVETILKLKEKAIATT